MPSQDEPMPEAFLARVAEQFKALSDPMRLAILNALFDGERCVGDLADQVGSSIANVSKHLAVLHKAGWVTRAREGTSIHYTLADTRTAALCELMCARVRERAAAEAQLAVSPSVALRRAKRATPQRRGVTRRAR